jgi:hypothetical protein
MKDNSLSSIVSSLGVKDSIELLEYALPFIAHRDKKIQQCLTEKNWECATKYAHRTLSSVRLYGSKRLEMLLQQVKLAGDSTINTDILQKELSLEFKEVSQSIKQWLALHLND